MKTSCSFLLIVIFNIVVLSQTVAQATLTYQRLTTGLDFPDFEKGKTDFTFDDINMDGHLDILTVGDHGSPYFNSEQHGICVWFGDGLGNFSNYMNGNFGYGGIAVGDVNNDGHKDVGYGIHHNYSATNWGDQLIEVVIGDGTGMNWELWDEGLATAGETWGMFGTAFADFNNDGFLDLVSVAFGGGSGLQVYLNQQDGTWQHSFGLLGGSSGLIVRVGDINNDGKMDFVTNHSLGKAWFGDGTGNFAINDAGLPPGVAFSGMDIGRIATYSSFGVSFINSSGGVNVYFWNNSNQIWVNYSGNLSASGVYQISQLYDMNNDGLLDVMAFGNKQFQLWLGDDTGNWTADATMNTVGNPGDGNALRAGGDLDNNGYPDLIILAERWTGSFIQVLKNELYVFAQASPADSLWIKPTFPNGGENFYPGSVQFIEWISEVPSGTNSSVTIEISAFGPDGPWWVVATEIPNNGKHQWIVPDYGSEEVFLRLTVNGDDDHFETITPAPFTIYGLPTPATSQPLVSHISVFPNPGKDFLYLQNHHLVENFVLVDITGKQVFASGNPTAQNNLPNLKTGVYFYTIILKTGEIQYGKWIRKSD